MKIGCKFITYYTKTNKRHTAYSIFNGPIDHLPDVAIVYFYAGASPEILYELSKTNQGIVIAGSGSGNYSKSWLEAIIDLTQKGIVFVRSSRISQSIIYDNDVFDPLHITIPANTLSPQKARVLLMLSLLHSTDLTIIKHYFQMY